MLRCASRSAGFQPAGARATGSRRQAAGAPAGWKPALRGDALRYDERDVVAERSAPRPHGVENLLRARACGERLMKSRLAPHLPARTQRLGNAVGIQNES